MIGKNHKILLTFAAALGLASPVAAQPPPRQAATKTGDGAKSGTSSPIVTRLLAFDKNGDGQLTIDEVTDGRLHRLFERADANKDGVVTKDELIALAAVLEVEMGQVGGRGGPGGGFGGPPDGGPGRRGQGGQGGGPPDGAPGRRGARGQLGGAAPDGQPGMPGSGGFGNRPQPGKIMPVMLQERLGLNAEQKTQVHDLQKDIDAKLAKILTSDQQKQLKELQNESGPPGGRGGRGRGGPGGRGGPSGGGPGGPGGGPAGGGPGGQGPDR